MKSHGGKRLKSGRNPIPAAEKKVPIGIYYRKDYLKLIGTTKAKALMTAALEQYLKEGIKKD